MRYVSTRDGGHHASLSEAIQHGIAPDGGLYVPERFPSVSPDNLGNPRDLAGLGARLLAPFFEGDRLEGELEAICREALSFPIPLRPLGEHTAVLELFHGPTAAFKDVGARFLAASLERLEADAERPLTVLVATSGDTGGAVAAAFHGRPGVEVVVLYPAGMVSPRQEAQLTCWGGNVRSFRVAGDFDACQGMVKEAFADPELRARKRLTSANSINICRLLPQMIYHASAALRYQEQEGRDPGFIIPSGNVGNATACLWVRAMGLPVREVVLAVNANRSVLHYLATGEWRPRATVSTLATAMDVGNPSNMERVRHLFPEVETLREHLRAFVVTDPEIRREIRRGPERWGQVWDPHTATAAAVRERLDTPHWILVATAHPAKFEAVVEPLVGHEVPPPPELATLLERRRAVQDLAPILEALRDALA
jgi:threonine synthase